VWLEIFTELLEFEELMLTLEQWTTLVEPGPVLEMLTLPHPLPGLGVEVGPVVGVAEGNGVGVGVPVALMLNELPMRLAVEEVWANVKPPAATARPAKISTAAER
jgi:hypothetical protein